VGEAAIQAEDTGASPVSAGAEPPAPPVVTVTRPEATRAVWKKATEYGVVILATFLATRTLLKLSGNALWLPPEWRDSMQLLIPGIGLGVYGMGRHCGKLMRMAYQKAGASHEGESPKHIKEEMRRGALSLLLLLTAVVLLISYFQLRTDCLYTFQPPAGWWERNFGDPGAADAEGGEGGEAGAAAHGGAGGLDDKIPSFLDREKSAVFVPRRWTADWKSRLLMRGQGNVRAGVQDYLDNDPMQLVDYLQAQGAPYRVSTTVHFLLLHLGIVGLVAFAGGLSFSPVESLAEMAGHRFSGLH
jgi:hypothetical protein